MSQIKQSRPVLSKTESIEKQQLPPESAKPSVAEPAAKPPSKSETIYDIAQKVPAAPKEAEPYVSKKVHASDFAKQAKPAPAPPSPRKPSAFEEKTGHILKKIWNWIVVGEEFRNPNVSMEYAVASAWLIRFGILILVLGAFFFLDYSIKKAFSVTKRGCLSVFSPGLRWSDSV